MCGKRRMENIMTQTLIYFLFVVVFICIFMFFRNNRVYKIEMQLLKEVSLRSRLAIDAGDNNWCRYHNWLNFLPSYNKKMFMISIWNADFWIQQMPK